MTTDDAVNRLREFAAKHPSHIDPAIVTVLDALEEAQARAEKAERERDTARWSAGILGDIARESSAGWQDAQARVARLETAIREALAIEVRPSNPLTMMGYELDEAKGYNGARAEFRRILTNALKGEGDA